MSIQLISVSYKTADIHIRSCFALTEEEQTKYMQEMATSAVIEECAVLSTCNRLEVYLYGRDENQSRIFSEASDLLFCRLHLPKRTDVAEYLRFYTGRKAVKHLFAVASGLDSMIVGEDQILGQVKAAGKRAMELGVSATYLNTCFRYGVTAAKRVKTETALSKTAVSAATIAVKAAKDGLGDLRHKNVLIIGASGKIGHSVYKNFMSEKGVRIYRTQRRQSHSQTEEIYYPVDYKERYCQLDFMDVIISATTSPHYTLTFDKVKGALTTGRKRVFIDLAVPPDIDRRVAALENTLYYNIDDFSKVAEENNLKKKKEAEAAGDILEEYQIQFEKWMVFQRHFPQMERMAGAIEAQARTSGMAQAIRRFFFALRESMPPEALASFMEALQEAEDKYEKN